MAWNGAQTATVLRPWEPRIVAPDLAALEADGPSVYANGRQVCLVSLRPAPPT